MKRDRPKRKDRVLVIGSAGLDIVGRMEEDYLEDTSNPAEIRTTHGGIGRNVAENLAHLGEPVSLITAVGTDQPGNLVLEYLDGCDVDTGGSIRTPQFPTGSYLGVISQSGKRHLALVDMRAMSALTPEYILSRQEQIEQAALVFIDSNLPLKTIRKIIAIARHAQVPICADPASSILAGKLRPYLARFTLVTPNFYEANILCQKNLDPPNEENGLELAREIINLGAEAVVIPMGKEGVCYATSETNGHVPAVETPVIDPTGAGDALTATLIYSRLNDISIDDAVRLGNQAASLTLRHAGTVYPDLTLDMLYSCCGY
jgi:pseudouridine kinase